MEKAIAQEREAIARNPNLANAYNSLGVALYQREQPQEAIAAWRQAIAIDPNLAEAFINLDNALKAQQTESAADL